MFQAIRLTNLWGEPVPILTLVAVIFIVLIMSLSAVSKKLTDRVHARLAT
jgi:ABC-type amino acid transport system permease subunit